MRKNRYIFSILCLLQTVFGGHSQSSVNTDSLDSCCQSNVPAIQAQNSKNEYIPYQHIVATPVLPDSADVSLHKHKAFWRAGAETVGFNIGLWAEDIEYHTNVRNSVY